MKTMIRNDERGLLFKNGNYERYLKPGKYFLNPLIKYEVMMLDINKPFFVDGKNINLFVSDQELASDLSIIELKDHELALHFEDGILVNALNSGKYAFWNVLKKHDFTVIDIRNPEVSKDLDISIYSSPKISKFIGYFDVANHEAGILYYNNILHKQLSPGRHFFWKSPISVVVKNIDLRRLQIDMTGQEIMTEDKVTLRLNFVCHYQIKDPVRILEIKNYEEQIYILLQLILREYVGSLKLDDLLSKKQEIGEYALEKLHQKSADFGVEFLFAGVKDVIIPGDIKDILNTVLIAEKKAMANVITRREETASTRSLLNTAKLMDENQTLLRLKELEYLEKICDKVGNISVMGGGNLLGQLTALLSKKLDE